MPFDFKKEYKEFYMPKNRPEIVNIPKVNYIAVRGKGNPNDEGGTYQQAVGVLYAVAYTLKMSYKTGYKMEGFFAYVVPPLEGFWWQDNVEGVDYGNKDAFNWISVIRLPDFVTKADFDWAVETASKKKKMDCSKAEFLTVEEGLCVQIMHIGAFDDEPATVAVMDAYLAEHGYVNDLNEKRLHHEIYMSDARKTAPEKWKTVIRHPIKKAVEFHSDEVILYVHGKGGNAEESEHYKKFFTDSDVYGFDYKAENPWDAKKEFLDKVTELSRRYNRIILIAGSIGAYFSMHAGIGEYIDKAFFISPIVNLEKLIMDMIAWAGTSESELEKKKIIPVDFGDDLSWEYLQYVRKNKISWNVPTEILYGSTDNLQSMDTIRDFVANTSSGLTIMEGGEHWFHTKEQMDFLDAWLDNKCR